MRKVSPKMDRPQKRRKAASLPRPPKPAPPRPRQVVKALPLLVVPSKTIALRSHRDALAIIFADAIADNEGTVFGAVGSQRYGKTYWLNEVLSRGFDLRIWERAFIHDVKRAREPQYEGEIFDTLDPVGDFAENPDAFDVPICVFTKPAWNEKPSLQSVCEVGVAVAESGYATVTLSDEVFHGTNGHRDWLKGAEIRDGEGMPTGKFEEALFPWQMREGCSQRISSGYTTQIPQELPTECRVLSKSVANFQLEGLAADASEDHFRFGSEGRRLMDDLQRGQFLLFRQGKKWDRTIYGPG